MVFIFYFIKDGEVKRSRPPPQPPPPSLLFLEPNVGGGIVRGLTEPFFTSISEDEGGKAIASVSGTEAEQRLLGLHDREINV